MRTRSRFPWRPATSVVVLAAAMTTTLAVHARQRTASSGEWRAYGGTNLSNKYSPLEQINRNNVARLRIVWRQSATPPEVRQGPNAPVPINYAHTPLMAGGLLYMSTGYGTVAALDAATGKVVWFEAPPPRRGESNPDTQNGADAPAILPISGVGQAQRGLAYWTDGTDARVITVMGRNLVALNAKTGKRYPEFGDGGAVDLTTTYDFPVTTVRYGSSPIVVRDVIVVGGLPTNGATVMPADIRGFDVRTGKRLWTFHVIPRAGDFGNDTWLNGSWKDAGAAGVWSFMSGDDELGYVYLPLESAQSNTPPSGDYYGGSRPGTNLFDSTLVCLNAKTGKRVWHYQLVHHDLWDWDVPAAPTLIDITAGGRKIKAVAQVTKHGFAFVFDRMTGQPVWPIEERAVPKGDVPGEWYSPTQPFPTKPPPYDGQEARIDDLVDFTPELRQEAIQIISEWHYGSVFTPPMLVKDGKRGSIQRPGTAGTTWNGAAFDPDTGILYVPSVHETQGLGLVKPTNPNDKRLWVIDPRCPFYGCQLEGPRGLPDPFKPPYGRITAIDLNQGTIKWSVANGDGPRDNPAIKHLNLPPLGNQGRAAPLVTKTLLFMGEGGREGVAGNPPQGGGKVFRAFDKTTGKVVWQMELPGGTTGAPMTYLWNGKQYIVIAVGWKDNPGELIALSLP